MHKRTTYLIDKKFQISTAARVIGAVIIAFLIIIAVTAIIISESNRRLGIAAARLEQAIGREKDAIETIISSAGSQKGSGARLETQTILTEHMSATAAMQESIRSLHSIKRRNLIVITVMAAVGIATGCFLFLYLIRLTHRIAGPISVIDRYLEDLMKGTTPDIRPLRKSDELKDFYQRFTAFIESLRRK